MLVKHEPTSIFFHNAHQNLRWSQAFTTASSEGCEANNVDLARGAENAESLFDQSIQEETDAL